MRSCFPINPTCLWIAAAVVAVAPGLFCQTAGLLSPQPAISLASAASVAALPIPVPQLQPTPEELGDAYMVHQRYQAAIAAYKNAPFNRAAIWNKMGVAYQLMFNNEEAASCYRKALKVDPKNADALNNLGSVFMEMKLYSSAEQSYRKAVKFNPKSALFRKNLGTALFAERRYKKGWQAYRAALALDSTIFSHHAGMRVENPASLEDRGAMNFYMAKSCAQAGLTTQAVEYLRLALNDGFTNPKKVLADVEFARLRDVPAFQQLMNSQGVYLTPLSAHPPVQQ